MADTDLVFSIGAQDAGYTQRFNEAYALITRLTTAEREYTATTVSLGTAQEIAAAKTRIMEEAERKVVDAIARSNDSSNKYAQTLDGLKNQYAAGQITQQQYTAGLTDLAGGIKGASEEGSNWAQTVTGINQAMEAGQKVVEGFKRVWDFAKEGAQIERIQTQFTNAAAEMGLSGENLMKRMQAAVKGTVDDEELASISTRALTENLVTGGDQIVQALELARAAAVRFGGTTQDRFEQIIRSADMLSTRGFKQLGIIVGDTKTIFENYAVTLGKTAESMTDEEKKQALLNVALEKGKDLVDKVGTSADDAATRMAQFETAITDLGDSLKVAAADALVPWLTKIQNAVVLFDPAASEADKLRAALSNLRASGVEPSKEALDALNLAIERAERTQQDLGGATDSAVLAMRSWKGEISTTTAVIQPWQQSMKDAAYGTGVLSGLLASGRVEAEKFAETIKAKDTAAINELKTAMAGAVQNEMTSFKDKQASLAEQAQKLAAQIKELQEGSSKTTIEHKMSAEELALAQAQLAQMELRASEAADTHTTAQHKGKMTAEEAAAAQQKASQAAAESAAQHEVLAAQIAVARDKIENANTSVTKYVDNSKRIAELKGEYDKINEEIGKNAKAHEEATKRILFGYLEQQLAAQGLTAAALPALNKLSEQWGLKSHEDIKAIENVMIAVNQFAKDKNLDTLTKSMQLGLGDIGKAADDASKLTFGLSDMVKGHTDKVNEAFGSVKQPSADLIKSMQDLQTSADSGTGKTQQLAQYGIYPLAAAFYSLNQQVNTFNTLVGQMPTSIPTVPSSGSGSGTGTHGGTGGEQAQYGADFIVPMNPRGGAGDYFPVIAAPGERVQVTPVGETRNAAGVNVSINIGSTSASAAEIQAVVFDTMTQVMREAAA